MIGYGGNAESKEVVNETGVVEITKDRMLGVMSFTPPQNNGNELDLAAINKIIAKSGLVSGIDDKLLEEIAINKKHNYKYIIARGTPPINGVDGTIEYFFDTQSNDSSSLKPKENEDGSVDFKTLDLIQAVKKDQLLVQITPPTLGEPGKSVLGKEIKQVRGKNVKLPKGKNVYASPDGLALLSSIEGQLIYDINGISVSETYVVEGNAGVATGDIEFSGNLLVKGNVESGFTIKAGGNIEVQGFVEGATIIAGNNIVLRHGIQGMDKGRLEAGGNIVAKFIQNSVVEAKGSLHTEAILHSQVAVDDSVVVEINKGLIVGGSVQATNVISAKIIGSPMSTATSIQISMTLSLHHRYQETQKSLAEKKQQLEQAQKNIRFVQEKLAKGEQIPKARLEKVKEMIGLQKQLQGDIQVLQAEHELLHERLQDYKEGSIKVRDVIYPGVKVTMGSIIKYIRREIKYASIYVEEKEIKVDTFS